MITLKKLTFLQVLTVVLLIYALTENAHSISAKPTLPGGEIVAGNQWLFVVGIDNYDNWPSLKTAVNDAAAVKDELLSRYYFDSAHLIELYDEQATRKNILEKFRYLANNVVENDSLIIFYAGHGFLDSAKPWSSCLTTITQKAVNPGRTKTRAITGLSLIHI